MEILRSGFDTFDMAFQGALPEKVLKTLEEGKDEAQATMKPTLVDLGPGRVAGHVLEGGKPGGYRYSFSTGPEGEIWFFKHNTDKGNWNIFVSVRSNQLVINGIEKVIEVLQERLVGFGAVVIAESVNRVDFAVDVVASEFVLDPKRFVAHPHSVTRCHAEKDGKASEDEFKPSVIWSGRTVTSVTIGKMPGRQIIVYDKRREAIKKKNLFMFDLWDIDPKDKTKHVWRVEIRAGKRHLKDVWGISTVEDLLASACDVIGKALAVIRRTGR
ncbi:MAG: hypothetical protein HN403_17155 [Rhodospirillales bacterium]|jgi:hypothetical protein|nr:hypothetical protein [Rhodospirillales bacterium]